MKHQQQDGFWRKKKNFKVFEIFKLREDIGVFGGDRDTQTHQDMKSAVSFLPRIFLIY